MVTSKPDVPVLPRLVAGVDSLLRIAKLCDSKASEQAAHCSVLSDVI